MTRHPRSGGTSALLASLDRSADRLGIELTTSGKSVRCFEAFGRTIKYRPASKGTVKCESFIDGQPDAVVIRTEDQMEKLFIKVVEQAPEYDPQDPTH